MKKVIFSAIVLTAAMTTSYAQTTQTPATTPAPTTAPAPATQQQDEKVKVEQAALPEPVKKVLAGDAYKEWKVVAAWTVKSKPDMYVIDLTKDDKTQSIQVSKDGKI
jgi:hypothetical protein